MNLSGLLGVIDIHIDPYALHLGSGDAGIHWYGVFYAVAFFTAYRYGVLPHVLKRGTTRQAAEQLLVITIITGLIGARLYFVIQQPNLGDYLRNPVRIIAVWEGGMAFFGAIIASLTTLAILARRMKLPLWMVLDAGAIFAVVGQPIGRIGNIINGDILGTPSNAFFATAYTFQDSHTGIGHCAVLQQHYQCGVGYQPAAVYEALGTILIGLILLAIRRRGVRDGVLVISYVAMYAVSQFLIFFLRDSEPVIGLGLKQAQWTAIGVLLIAVPLLVVAWRRWAPDEIDKETPTPAAA